MGQMQDGLGGLTDMMGQTRDILHWLNQQDLSRCLVLGRADQHQGLPL